MVADQTERIRELCRRWRAAAIRDGGGLIISDQSEMHRLRANGVLPHGLTYDELRVAAVELTGILRLPRGGTVVDRDHLLLWAWAAELTTDLRHGVFTDEEGEVRELVTTAFRAALSPLAFQARPSDLRLPLRPPGGWLRQLDVHAQELLIRSHEVLVYLAFPALEAVAKKATSAFLTYDGRVQRPFSTPWRAYGAGQRCSRVRDQLALLHGRVAGASLRADLDEVRAQLTKLFPGPDPFELIDAWRNESLHGEGLETIGGIVLSLIALVALDMLKDRYEVRRLAVRRGTDWALSDHPRSSGDFPPWVFYAPVLSTTPEVPGGPPLIPE